MITIGIHIGHFSIRVSQSYERPSDSRIHFDAVEWPGHAHTRWYACYGGGVPNAYDPASGKVGYDAIDEVGLEKASRLDLDFFQDMLGGGARHDRACQIWAGLQRSLRRCPALRVAEYVQAGLVLDGVELSSPTNRWMPWQRVDRTADLEEQLRALGPKAGFRDFEVVSNRSAIEGYVSTQDHMRAGDLIAMVGSSQTKLWEIGKTCDGAIRPLSSTVGLEYILAELKRSGGVNDDVIERVLKLLQAAPGQQDRWLDCEAWRQKQRPIIKELRRAHLFPSAASRRLLIAGEGAVLLQALARSVAERQVEQWEHGHLSIPACGAAAVALLHSRASKE